MAPPVWLEECSCGALTGNMSICVNPPAPSIPRRGHEGHEVRYVQLIEDGSAPMTAEQRTRMRASAEAWVAAATNPTMRLAGRQPPKEKR